MVVVPTQKAVIFTIKSKFELFSPFIMYDEPSVKFVFILTGPKQLYPCNAEKFKNFI